MSRCRSRSSLKVPLKSADSKVPLKSADSGNIGLGKRSWRTAKAKEEEQEGDSGSDDEDMEVTIFLSNLRR